LLRRASKSSDCSDEDPKMRVVADIVLLALERD
jgi:hypothetical protein